VQTLTGSCLTVVCIQMSDRTIPSRRLNARISRIDDRVYFFEDLSYCLAVIVLLRTCSRIRRRLFEAFTTVPFCSLAVLGPRVGHTMDEYFLHLSLSSIILIDSSTESPVHVLMLSIQVVRGLPRRRAPGIVPSIISDSFSRQLLCFVMV